MTLPLRPCAGVALINPAGLLFAGQRIDGYPDAWQMPQGGIHSDEEPEQAALRELREETGVGPDHVQLLGVTADWHEYELPPELTKDLWQGKYRGQRQKWFAYRLTAGEEVIDITAHDAAEFRCWAWMRADDLISRIVAFKRDIYRQVLAEFSEWLA